MRHFFERVWRMRVLWPVFVLMGIFYGLAIRFRNCLYDWGVLRRHKAGVPVISVGNVAVGGTGKTPLTAAIANALRERKRTAILSRGYGGGAEKGEAPVEISEGQGPLYPWAFCGDEPFLLASNLPGVRLFAGRDRVKAAHMAVAKGAETLLLDDGMQHRRLARDLEIVLVDGATPLKRGRLLPRGRLREPLSSLRRADMVVVNHTEGKVPASLKSDLRRITKAPVVAASYKSVCLPGEPCLKGKSVAIFCAIAKPERFRQTVEAMGASVVDELFCPDHAQIEPEALDAFLAASGADLALCTEKDWVKLPITDSHPLPLHYIKISLEIGEGQADWRALLSPFS